MNYNALVKTNDPINKYLDLLQIQDLFTPEVLNRFIAAPHDFLGHGYKLEFNECFVIKRFSETPYCLDILRDTYEETSYNEITRTQFRTIFDKKKRRGDLRIPFIIIISDDSKHFFLQKIVGTSIIRNKTIWFGDEVKFSDSNQVVIKENPDAFYDKDSDSLYFKNFGTIKTFFKNIENIARAATEAEIRYFINHDIAGKQLLKFDDNFDFNNIGVLNSKQIFIALAGFCQFNESDKLEIISTVPSFYDEIVLGEQDYYFEIGSNLRLKELLTVLNEKCYITMGSRQTMVSNSSKKTR